MVVLFAVGVAAYAIHVRNSARALIDGASQIRSLSDAEQQAANWRRVSRGYDEYQSNDRTKRGYRLELNNGFLSTLHLVPSTGVQVQVTTASGQLQGLLIGMYTNESSVWVQEEFSQSSSRIQSERNPSGTPTKTVVILGPNADDSTRARAFAFDANCLVKLAGCKNANEMLPSIPELETALGPQK